AGNLEDRAVTTANTYVPIEKSLVAARLISSTYLDDDADEQNIVTFMPMLLESVVRAHARAIDESIIIGTGSHMDDLNTAAGAAGTITNVLAVASPEAMGSDDLLAMRLLMGKYGVNPAEMVYIVNVTEYLNLLTDAEFQDVNLVGSDATKLKGAVGRIWGSNVIVSDEFPAVASGAPAAFAVYPKNYVIPKLRGIRLESDREVAAQRQFIVASQSMGFNELVAGVAGSEPVTLVDYTT
ncbi:unnamed protein product, partial [marine sediment metagenome]